MANAVPTLQREGSIPAGTLLTPNLAWYSNREREAVEAWLDSEPAWATIAWTGELSARRAVLQGEIDEPISLGAAHEAFRSAAGLRSAPDATSAWLVGDTGKSVRQLADECIAAGSGDSANAEAVGSLQSSSSIDLG